MLNTLYSSLTLVNEYSCVRHMLRCFHAVYNGNG